MSFNGKCYSLGVSNLQRKNTGLQRSYLLQFVLYLVLAVKVTIFSLLSPTGPWQHKETTLGPLPAGSFPVWCMVSFKRSTHVRGVAPAQPLLSAPVGMWWLLGSKVRTDWLQHTSLSYLHCDVCKVSCMLQKDFKKCLKACKLRCLV